MKTVVGNNPLAVGAPFEGAAPFVLDIAMSVSSRGRMRHMAQKGEPIPEGWALDSKGRPTTDPLEGLKGFSLPFGLHKGYGLALAIDILSGVLTGAGFSAGVKSLVQQWEEPQHIGHFFIVIDPVRFMTWEIFSERMRQLCDSMRGVPPADPETPVMIPGEPEAHGRKSPPRPGNPPGTEDLPTSAGPDRGASTITKFRSSEEINPIQRIDAPHPSLSPGPGEGDGQGVAAPRRY